MADIALLVAEEFEARRRTTHEDGIAAINLLAVSYWKEAERKAEQGLTAIKDAEAVRGVARQIRDHLHNPRSPLVVAAVDGLFSA